MIIQHIKIIFPLIAVVLFILFALPIVTNAQVNNLEVIFEPDPLFGAKNMLPGDSATGLVHVTNNSASSMVIIMEAINESDPDGFGEGMFLTVTDTSSLDELYFDSLANFFSSGEIELFTLDAEETAWIEMVVNFPSTSKNEFQELTLGFDLLVGFQGEGSVVVDDAGKIKVTNSVGGGGTVGYEGLLISNEAVVDITVDPPAGTALIAWNTNYSATSQVIYGLVSGAPYSINLLLPNFGYPSSSIEQSDRVTSHLVLLTGLTIGETYSYRVVSHASPATVGFEHTFTLLEDNSNERFDGIGGDSSDFVSVYDKLAGTTGENVSENDDSVIKNVPSPEDFSDTKRVESEIAESQGEANDIKYKSQTALVGLAIPNDLYGLLECIVYFLTFVVLIQITYSILFNRNISKGGERTLNRKLFNVVGAITSIIIAYFIGYFCVIMPLVMFGVIFLLLWVKKFFAVSVNKS